MKNMNPFSKPILLALASLCTAAALHAQSPLHRAAEAGDLELVNLLITLGKDDVNAFRNGEAPLHVAARNGHAAIVNALIDAGANVNIVQDARSLDPAPLHAAARNGHTAIVNALIDAGADVNIRWWKSNFNSTPLYEAALNGHTATVNALIDAGANVNPDDNEGRDPTPLHVAALNGHTAIVDALIDAGANVHARLHNTINVWSSSGQLWLPARSTPLHGAAWNGYAAIVDALINAGANVHADTTGIGTPLHVAARNGHAAIVDALIDAGANVNADTTGIGTPLHEAVRFGSSNDDCCRHSIIGRRLIAAGADIAAEHSPLYLESDLAVVKAWVATAVQPQAPDLAIEREGGNVIVYWRNGTLQSAPTSEGPWETLYRAAAEGDIHTFELDSPAAFFRLR
ncbi:MAG: Phosphocholine transferase AnkX [Verrucomicrobia subdivision 3 bacterium]|nr:Phosphocholine transferase AnkX [Limisphaerales bacterium]MCS1414270.1 Phosphocholine transferase AnkX [Limisphaerales bacterium]